MLQVKDLLLVNGLVIVHRQPCLNNDIKKADEENLQANHAEIKTKTSLWKLN